MIGITIPKIDVVTQKKYTQTFTCTIILPRNNKSEAIINSLANISSCSPNSSLSSHSFPVLLNPSELGS